MGINKMTGTPWHVERVRRDEDDERRHKSKCKFYTKDKCVFYGYKCYGSAHCESYKAVEKEITYISIKKTSRKMIPYGTFKVLFIDENDIMDFEIGKNIQIDAPLINEIIKINVNEIFTYNNIKIKLLSKNIEYK